jgi:hypothetical protein
VPYYPADRDYWTETSTTPFGGHWVAYGGGRVSASFDFKAVGVGSIYTYRQWYYSGDPNANFVSSGFILDDGFEYDGTKSNSQLKFRLALGTVYPGLTGQCYIYLVDSKRGIVAQEFQANPDKTFQEKSFELGEGKGWLLVGIAFDWTKIKEVRFSAKINPPSPAGSMWVAGEYWVDQLYFYYEIGAPLTMDSKTLDNKTVKRYAFLTSPLGARTELELPFGPQGVSPSGTWMIEIVSKDFVKWDNEDTNKQRTIEIRTVPVTVTAYFSGESPPISVNWPLIAAGVILIAGIGYYSLRSRR